MCEWPQCKFPCNRTCAAKKRASTACDFGDAWIRPCQTVHAASTSHMLPDTTAAGMLHCWSGCCRMQCSQVMRRTWSRNELQVAMIGPGWKMVCAAPDHQIGHVDPWQSLNQNLMWLFGHVDVDPAVHFSRWVSSWRTTEETLDKQVTGLRRVHIENDKPNFNVPKVSRPLKWFSAAALMNFG